MDHHNTHHMIESESSTKEYLKFICVIVGITIASVVLQKSFGISGLADWMRWFMGVFFVVFASFKFIGYKMFSMMFAGYDIVAKHFKLYGYAYPFIELALGLLYIFNIGSITRDVTTLIIMSIGSIGVFQEIKKRSGIHCACLGNIIKLPLSTVSLVEDVGMGLMALVMIVLY